MSPIIYSTPFTGAALLSIDSTRIGASCASRATSRWPTNPVPPVTPITINTPSISHVFTLASPEPKPHRNETLILANNTASSYSCENLQHPYSCSLSHLPARSSIAEETPDRASQRDAFPACTKYHFHPSWV